MRCVDILEFRYGESKSHLESTRHVEAIARFDDGACIVPFKSVCFPRGDTKKLGGLHNLDGNWGL